MHADLLLLATIASYVPLIVLTLYEGWKQTHKTEEK